LNDVQKISEELAEFYASGGKTIVDTMPANAGRNVLKMAEVSRRSKVQIIIPTGIHLEIYYPVNHWRYSYSEDQLTNLFVDDIAAGIDEHDYSGPFVKRTSHKAGIIKIATGNEKISVHQEKIINAAVNAHLTTGAPVITHTNSGELALEQALLFKKLGANLQHVVISHLDKNKNIEYHKKVLDTGINVEYDSAFRWELKGEENHTFQFLKQLLPLYPNQITMGMDMAKNIYWKSYGGHPGITYLINNVPDFLKQSGLQEYYQNIFWENPKKIFSFSTTG
ncbi:MAG: phosphotriesterase family protein, partial [Prolixibacteraceae bacterium]